MVVCQVSAHLKKYLFLYSQTGFVLESPGESIVLGLARSLEQLQSVQNCQNPGPSKAGAALGQGRSLRPTVADEP